MSLNHPAKDQLIAFGQGKLAAEESSHVEQHLEVCRECCETLLDLKDDTFVGLVKIAQSSDSDRRMGTPARPDFEIGKTEADKAGTGNPPKADHPTDAATLLVQSGEAVSVDELPAELRDHPRYRIVELIGRGGMGNVYRAEHRLMNRPVAIKLINSQLIRQPNAVERFRREVQAAAKLTHPNIVTAYDAEQAGDVHFLVMEFVEGTDLASVVKHRGPMSVAEACDCIRQAAEGLQHAHEKGMVHRDIKPHNLMLSAEGQVRILDFGLAGFASLECGDSSPLSLAQTGDQRTDTEDRQSGDESPQSKGHLTAAGSVMGTPDYIAPEQAKDAHSADIRADIYSLGCTLHFLLTGNPPFVAENVLAKLKAHAQETPPPLTTLRNDVPAELQRVVAKMMAKTPAERFQSPAEVAAALAPFSRSAQAPPKRRTLRTMLAAVAVILLAGVIFITTDKGRVEIRSERDDVELVIRQNGAEIKAIDLQTGTQVTWLPSGEYNVVLRDGNNYINLEKKGFKLSRWGKEIVTVKRTGGDIGVEARAAWDGWSKDAPPPAIAPFNAVQAKQHQEAWAKYLGVPVEHTNSIGMKFVLIPPGEFTMGNTPEVIEQLVKHFREANNEHTQHSVLHARSEGPQHKVILTQPRYLAVCEVTQTQYEKVMGKNPSHFAASGAGKDLVAGLDTASHPVEKTSWNDAADFCVKLSQKESLKPAYFRNGQSVTMLNGNGYRLPTEAEWEFSCRAGSTARWWTGDKVETLVETAWIVDNAGNRTHAVGELRSNPFGLCDIHGNVLEWCQDKWESNYYGRLQDQPALDPQNTSNESLFRVARGGSWIAWQYDCAAPSRWPLDPTTSLNQIGFRVSLDIDAVRKTIEKPAKTTGSDSPIVGLKDAANVLMYLNDPRNNRGGSVPVALLGQNGRVAFRFGTWLVVFEGIACDPKAGILGFSSFNIPHRGSSGEGTIDFGAGDKLPGVLIKYKFANEQNEISINNHRFKLRGKATRLEFDDKAYDATNSLQTILVARDGSTKLETPKKVDDKPEATAGVSQNLITDPSFESTGLTQLPRDWRAWLNDGPDFRCEVVAGGHTGQRSLRISGKGTRGVVFGNDLKADRTKRYALKGWVKFEGDKDARALIKLNYFRGGEFLGVHDLVGATADQPGWHLFEKTDTLDAFPTADHFYAMCHVEGSGTGWFDDLELIAYDRDKLPSDFDARHGRHNRLHGPNSLHRWVGTWDTEYAFRETDNSPTETKLSMTTTSERTLGNYFLMSHAKAVPVPPKDRKPTPADPPANTAALGSEERLLFLTFDQNLGAFRQWFFSSNGKVFEWRGPWNQEKQSLELRMLPDASNLFSNEHFVDDDHIETKLWFQYVMGQRDAGRWTATRKAFDGKVDVPIAKTHVAEPAELSQLNKFAGEWTIRAKYKPSVWNPLPREETIRETSVWILGGRFLMTRAFNEKDELTSIWIATYEPKEKSNRFWFYNADGSSGEWRLTWDEPSSGFHFRAVDLPTGWSGTGFNRWVNEDSLDNQALIKDDNGRVLLDSTQERRRKK